MATRQVTRKGRGLMIMKNVTIFNILRSSELGGFGFDIIPHNMSSVIPNASFMVFYLILNLNTMRGLFFPFFR